MQNYLSPIEKVLTSYSLVTAFAVVGLTLWISYTLAERVTRGRIHGSAIAILIGLLLAYFGGVFTGGKQGLADVPMLSGLGLMGGAMLRDLAIVATAFGVRMSELRQGGWMGILSLFIGIFVSFAVGGMVAYAFGYRDAVSITTIGGGAATYIVGPVTGAGIGASTEIIALSVAAGLVKAVLVMTMTPLLAKHIGLDSPRAAMIFGGLMGTNSGVMAGLAATDPKLVPYGAMTATFYTGLGCLLGPSVVFFIAKMILPS
ncbi:MAG: malonate transporter subunit MadM [Verrucomicrobia bacterium]|nr:malonate transporter subunit MadM [Verrucomicrobiota bacterium]